MAKIMQRDENKGLRKRMAKHGAIPLNTERLMSKIRFGKLARTKFVHMNLKIPEIKVSVRAFESLGQQRYAERLRNGGHEDAHMQREIAHTAEEVEAALSLQVLSSVRAPLVFLGDTRDFADWLSLDFIFD